MSEDDIDYDNIHLKHLTNRNKLEIRDTKKTGHYVSLTTGFILVMFSLTVAVGTGIVVLFADPPKIHDCDCGAGNASRVKREALFLAPPPPDDSCVDYGNAIGMTTCDVCSSLMNEVVDMNRPKQIHHVRLPKSLMPTLYTLELTPNLYTSNPDDFTFDGKLDIHIYVFEQTSNITLHANELRIHYESLSLVAVIGSAPVIMSYSQEGEFAIFMLDGWLEKHKTYMFHVEFTGRLINDLRGLYSSQYVENNVTKYMAATQFESTAARKAFPCFDEPAIKAAFHVTLLRKPPLVSLSNMPIIRSEPRNDGYIADVYETTRKMSSYLLAFVVGDFTSKKIQTDNNVTYGAWARPEVIDQVDFALDAGVRILQYYEKYFNVIFPLPKQDMIALPDFAPGAMENWGLITYRETLMLYDPNVSSTMDRQGVGVVIAHELAHQWFGDLVSPVWWDDLWLNEGFATFVEYLGVDFLYPEWRMFDQFVVIDLQDVMIADALKSSHPVYVPVHEPSEIGEIFDKISYGKGGSILRMIRFFLGDQTFRIGLQRYLTRLAFDVATHDDLWYALGNQSVRDGSNYDVKRIMDTWTLQMNYPVVTVRREQGRLVVTQDRFLIDHDAEESQKFLSPFGYKWEIPFTYTTDAVMNFAKTQVTMMHTNMHELVISDPYVQPTIPFSWVLGNLRQYGFYRVNYEPDNWEALIHQLSSDHLAIESINRAQLINDAWNLANSQDKRTYQTRRPRIMLMITGESLYYTTGAGLLNLTYALDVMDYIGYETDYVPWKAAAVEIDYVYEMLRHSQAHGAFQNYMISKLQNYQQRTSNSPSRSHIQKLADAQLISLACKFNVPDCVLAATTLYQQWMQSNGASNPIDVDLRSALYCAAIKAGGIQEWEFAHAQYKSSLVAAEKARLLAAMACTTEPWIISRYLGYTLDKNEIRRQDALNTLGLIAETTIGRPITWDFLRHNWDMLRTQFGYKRSWLANRFALIARAFNTEYQLEQVKEFIEMQREYGFTARKFDQTLETIRGNIKWMHNSLHIITHWLTAHGFPPLAM